MIVSYRQPRSLAMSPVGLSRPLMTLGAGVAALWLMSAAPAFAGGGSFPVVPAATSGSTMTGPVPVPGNESDASPSETPSRSGITAPGVNPTCLEAARAVSTARAAALRAAIDERTPQPPSVMQTTCFNEAAGVAATQGGNVFSGDFMSDIQPIVGSALGSMYKNFDSSIASFFSDLLGGSSVADAIGSILGALAGGAFGADASTLKSEYDCTGMREIWDSVLSRGAKPMAMPDLKSLVNGTAPSGAGEAFMESFNASKGKGVFSNAKRALDALPKAQVPSYTGQETLCEVLGKSPGFNGSVQGCQ